MHAIRHRSFRECATRFALCAALLGIACGQDGDHYAPLGSDREAARATVVAGDVRDPGDNAVVDALVVIEPSADGVPASAEFLAKSLGSANAISTPGRRVTTTDVHGRFAFDNVATGDYYLQVIADDHLGAMQSIHVPISFVDTVYADVNLTPTGTFSGLAELENAASHQGTVVYVQGTSYVAVTDAGGSYAISNVPVGSYTIRAEHAHYLEDTENGSLTTAGENVVLGDMLLKIDSNIPPVANIASADPQIEDNPTNFTASGSDVDGTVVLYEWDWENDGTFDYSSPTTANTSHTYSDAGLVTAKLRVTDNQGAIGLAAIVLDIVPFDFNRVYMATTGSDSNDGSAIAPVLTLTKAYQIALLEGKTEIHIATGVYSGAPAFVDGISIFGGRDLPSWDESPSGTSQFGFAATRATANNITGATLIRRVRLNMSLPAGGTNSIALYSLGSTASLRFEECQFAVANGLGGANGAGGNNGAAGNSGIGGNPGSCDGAAGGGGAGGTSPGGCQGGNGGVGGPEVPNPNNNGAPGNVGACGGGGGGTGGLGEIDNNLFSCNAQGNPGGNGVNGAAGSPGSNGTPGSSSGSIVADEWVPGLSGAGTIGTSGRGGGGGGGGGGQAGQLCNDGGGNGGGGGGGGGAPGSGGQAGTGGRASFCVMLVNSSPSFISCVFERGFGGTGGNGAAGGAGGGGGNGGAGATACVSEIGRGGNGGNGGVGGAGGGGAGGAGGPSYGIYRAGTSTPVVSGANYLGGGAGAGGAGGGTASNGPTGLFGNIN